MNEQQIAYLFYNFAKKAVDPTREFMEWHDNLCYELNTILKYFLKELSFTLPYWVYVAFIENIEKSCSKNELELYINKNSIIKNFLKKYLYYLVPVLLDWQEFISKKYIVRQNITYISSTASNTIAEYTFFSNQENKLRRTKRTLDLSLLDKPPREDSIENCSREHVTHNFK